MESCPQAVEIPVDTQRGCGGTIFRKVRMSQELRVRIDDDAHAYLKAVCTEHSLTLPQVVNALIWQAQQAKVEADTKLDVVLLQLQRVQEMLEAILAVPEAADPVPAPVVAGGSPFPRLPSPSCMGRRRQTTAWSTSRSISGRRPSVGC